MAYYTRAYPNLLQGVSRKDPYEQGPGHLHTQVNMLSDPVDGLRRRPGARYIAKLPTQGQHTRVYDTDLGGRRVAVLVSAESSEVGEGQVTVVDESTGEVLAETTHPYLYADTSEVLPEDYRRNIRAVTLDDAVFIHNNARIPIISDAAEQSEYLDSSLWGFVYVVTGAPNTTYSVTVTRDADGDLTTEISHTTGSSVNDPENVASALATAINNIPSVSAYRDGAYITVAITGSPSYTPRMTISSDSPATLLRTSNQQWVRTVEELPARLNYRADNFIVNVGTLSGLEGGVYYRYDHITKRWTEDAERTAMVQPSDLCLQLTVDGSGEYHLEEPSWERRAAGDAETNQLFRIFTDGITGMSAFQGRLVFFSNEYVCMSAAGNPYRFFRSTTADLVDGDPIEIGAVGDNAAPYEYAAQLDRDLVVFSKRHQAIVPGKDLLTPRTANLSVFAHYEVSLNTAPVAFGPRICAAYDAGGYIGVLDFKRAEYTDSIIAEDVTKHIPGLVAGPAIGMVASSVAQRLLVQGADGTHLIRETGIVQSVEGEVMQDSWGIWDLRSYGKISPFGMYIDGPRLYLAARTDLDLGSEVLADQHLLAVVDTLAPNPVFLDYWEAGAAYTIGTGSVTIPADYSTGAWVLTGEYPEDTLTDHTAPRPRVYKVLGDGRGQCVNLPLDDGAYVLGGVVPLADASPGDVYTLGMPYTSVVIPVAPVIKDRQGGRVTTSRGVLHQYRIALEDTGRVMYRVGDSTRPGSFVETSVLRLNQSNLASSSALIGTGLLIAPARVDLNTARLELLTDDCNDMVIRSIEYGFKYTQRYKRG